MGYFYDEDENREGFAVPVSPWLSKKIYNNELVSPNNILKITVDVLGKEIDFWVDHNYLIAYSLENQQYIVLDENDQNHFDFFDNMGAVPSKMLDAYLKRVGFEG